jgi:hypothetical protein
VFLRTHHKDIRGLLDVRGAEPFVQRPLHTRHEFITGPVGRAVHSRFGLQCVVGAQRGTLTRGLKRACHQQAGV